jgi:tetratricopeptide (TPR) repeat protein
LTATATSPVRADLAQDQSACNKAKASPQPAIAACTRLLRTLQMTPHTRAITYYSRGNAYFLLRQFRRAVADYTQATRLNPRYFRAHYNRGLTYVRLKQYPQAIASWDQAIRLSPRDPDAYYYRGLTYHRLGDRRLAITQYSRAIHLNPRYADAYFARGLAYEHIGNRRRAIQNYRHAYRLGQRRRRDAAAALRRMGLEP